MIIDTNLCSLLSLRCNGYTKRNKYRYGVLSLHVVVLVGSLFFTESTSTSEAILTTGDHNIEKDVNKENLKFRSDRRIDIDDGNIYRLY